tara:strand:- start:451 stop:1416 length:966 start_codon:yes stop_codon:yes gene_type:complete
MNKRKNYLLAVLLLTFILVGVFSFDYIITQISITTGQASSGPGTVSLTIDPPGPPGPPTPGPQKSGRGTKREIALEISTLKEKNIQTLHIKANEKEEKQVTLVLKNTGSITLNLEIEDSIPILSLNKKTITLNPQEETTLTLTIYAEEIGTYTGLIIFKDDYLLTQLPTIIVVNPKYLDYLVSVTIPQSFKTVQPGKEVFAKIRVTKLNGGSLVLHYLLKDMQNSIIHEEHERIVIKNELAIDKTIKLADNIELGEHAFITTVDYQGTSISDADNFVVAEEITPQKEQPQQTKKQNKLVLLLLIVFLILVTQLLLHKIRKN